jgi:hypothetical protein
MKTLFALIAIALFATGCANISAQETTPEQAAVAPTGNAILSGHYIYTSTGVLNPTTSKDLLWDGGIMEADGAGHITQQCGGPSYGTKTDPMNCATHWIVQMGISDDGVPVNPRYGIVTSDMGDKATIACTETGKICVMTSRQVQWAWTARLEKE